MITQDQVKDLFEYRKGKLYWKIIPARNIKASGIAGSLNFGGYLQTTIKNKLYLNHRIIFLMFHGYLPKVLDHIDGNRLNNQIENLREATAAQNQHNSKKPITNTSGVKCVFWHKQTKKWQVKLKTNGVSKSFGLYNDIKVAKFIAETMRYKYHGAFANHGGVE